MTGTATETAVPAERRPAFLITIDTEGDNLWSAPQTITTNNSRFLPRFQSLCEKYGLRPTYLTDWEMAHCDVFREFGEDVVARGAGELGMHIHGWNTPPLDPPLTADDHACRPYLMEYPEWQMREKIRVMTDTLEQTFCVDVVSHRSGRWALDSTYVRALMDTGYCVDCSVTPHVSWRGHTGAPGGNGGTDYTHFPETAYFIDPDDISRRLPPRPGAPAGLLEVPVTVSTPRYSALADAAAVLNLSRAGARVANRFFPRLAWLRPSGKNRRLMLGLLDAARVDGRDYVEFILHSSEFMPGGSPTFPDARSIERLYDDMEALFASAAGAFVGATLSEYYEQFVSPHDAQPAALPRPARPNAARAD